MYSLIANIHSRAEAGENGGDMYLGTRTRTHAQLPCRCTLRSFIATEGTALVLSKRKTDNCSLKSGRCRTNVFMFMLDGSNTSLGRDLNDRRLREPLWKYNLWKHYERSHTERHAPGPDQDVNLDSSSLCSPSFVQRPPCFQIYLDSKT